MKKIKYELESRILFNEIISEKNDIFTHPLLKKKLMDKDKEVMVLMRKFEILFSIIERNLYKKAYRSAFFKLIFLKKIKTGVIARLSQ